MPSGGCREACRCRLLDIAMPGMDGIETLGRILDIDSQIPIVLNTAYSSY